ncbi:MAG: serine--tRNA ligase [Deltaproteobacteria bacterium]|jgi:seryl-tRNA synthetase|nr:serine--tRNA ligase [Deltaproteobacteria bacterium]MCL5879618.1 serine--tRNA ligase [Deltaproteobacteria bacterium]MDA8305027.1 serine--tRNA ligase [Deltaproteobacteria bacterium]
MIDIKLIREQREFVKKEMEKLFVPVQIDEIYEFDESKRKLLYDTECLRNTRKILSKEIAAEKNEEVILAKKNEVKRINELIKTQEDELSAIEQKLNALMLNVPNLPDSDVPVGRDETENVVVSYFNAKKKFDFKPKTHFEIGEKRDLIDFERGVKISGTRFYVLKKGFAKLQRALINFMLDTHITYHDYEEVYPPYMVNEACLVGTGQLPKFSDTLYKDDDSGLWFVPTAEVPVTNMYRDEIIDIKMLPIKHAAYTACFRKEKMSAGKDTRGIKRGHQFDKVELVKITTPETAKDELFNLINDVQDILNRLDIPHRLVKICTGDLSFSAKEKYDVEVYAPGMDEWLEVSSCSNFGSFQARRANIKFKRDKNSKAEFVNTLNGSGLALPRVMIAIIENYQTKDGYIRIPNSLKPYFGIEEFI